MISQTNNRILVTGASGLLGPYLCQRGNQHGKVFELGRTNGLISCDLVDRGQTECVISEVSPDIVIHAAAMTDVDGCEINPNEADLINCRATANLIDALPKNCRLIYISTDQVYPDQVGPHAEGSEAPTNKYGQTKLGGELEALKHGNTIVLRTNMFGQSLTENRRSLSDFIIESLSDGTPITLFRDVLFSPLNFVTLAEYVWQFAFNDYRGVCNLGSREGLTKAEFGLAVAIQKKLPLQNIAIGASTKLSFRAPRPLDLRMHVNLSESILGATMPTTLEEIAKL
jgi:dTDP-4-dehydrorhamnose reductase